MYKIIAFLSIALIFFSCRKDDASVQKGPQNQFIIIGHAYGNPVDFKLSLYDKLPPIVANIETFINPTAYVFTGDVVAKPTAENWINILFQFDSLGIDNYWIAPGNHDLGSSYFLDNIQSEPYFSKRINHNLFLVLNTNFSGWTINQPQIDFVYNELQNIKGIKNIFVFSHQVWWNKTLGAEYDIETINTTSQYLLEGDQSFWTDAFPLFQNLNLPTYFFAGDIGAWDFIPAFVENKFDNFYFYASGVGGGAEDNVLNVKTYENGNVAIEKIDF